MSKITVYWDNDEKTVIVLQFQDGWDWSDFQEVSEETYAMLDQVDHPVVQVFDLTEAEIIPAGSISHGRHVLANRIHPNLRISIMVGVNTYFTALYQVMQKILPQHLFERWNIHLANSYDEAYEIINNLD